MIHVRSSGPDHRTASYYRLQSLFKVVIVKGDRLHFPHLFLYRKLRAAIRQPEAAVKLIARRCFLSCGAAPFVEGDKCLYLTLSPKFFHL